MKLQEAKNLNSVFKPNLNQKSGGKDKSVELKCALENIKLL